jgi:hypothetical protein
MNSMANVSGEPPSQRSSAVVGHHCLEVALKHGRSVALPEEDAARLNDAGQRFAYERRVLAEILRDDGRPAGRAGVVARVREAREALDEDLEFEQRLDGEACQPSIARLGLLAPQSARVAQEIVVRGRFFIGAIESSNDDAEMVA